MMVTEVVDSVYADFAGFIVFVIVLGFFSCIMRDLYSGNDEEDGE